VVLVVVEVVGGAVVMEALGLVWMVEVVVVVVVLAAVVGTMTTI
jgi:hypothetical protein